MKTAFQSSKPIVIWLFTTCFLIWLMIMLGGATRLTHSGLSIVEWKPIVGIIPPLSELSWTLEFEKYKQFPEYKLINFDMTLSEFKFIYFMEYTHRLLGRLIGLFFFLPLAFFWIRGQFSPSTKKTLTLAIILGLAQGAMGWYMVKSGLVKNPAVSAYRLTAHLLLALFLFGILFWSALKIHYESASLNKKYPSLPNKKSYILVHISAAAILLTITYGGFVAGLKAGKIYNTYPLMGGQFLPSEWNFMSPIILNFVENAATVQWTHRTLAILTLIIVLISMHSLLQKPLSKTLRNAALLTMLAISTQVIIGITTLLWEVPVSLGTLHQGMGVIVFMLIIYVMFLMGHIKRNYTLCTQNNH